MARCVLVRDPRVVAGGFETWVETLAQGLPQRGVPVTVLVPGDPSSVGHRLGGADLVQIVMAEEPHDQATHVVRSLEHLAARGDAGVFFTMAYPYINIAGLNLGGSPWISIPVLHGRHPSVYDWIAAGLPARIVVPSVDYGRTIRRELRKRIGFLRALGRVMVIPHGVRIPARELIEVKLGRAPQRPLAAVALTRLDEDAKRPFDYVRIAARAMERGTPIALTIAGNGPAAAKTEALARQLGVNVSFAGAVPHERACDLLLASDVLLSTSDSEAFGLAIAEALACGCAVVSADIPGSVQELVTGETGARVPVGEIDGFVDALTTLANSGLRAKGRAGHELVAARFGEARMLDSYAKLIASLGSRARADRQWRVREPLLDSPSDLTLPPLLTRIGRRLAGG